MFCLIYFCSHHVALIVSFAQVNGLLQDSEEVTDKSEGQPETEKLEVNPEVKVASVEGL